MTTSPEVLGDQYFTAPIRFLRYKETGEIAAETIETWGHVEDRLDAGQLIVVTNEGSIGGHYVDPVSREVRVRTEMPGRLEGQSIVGLPVPCVVQIERTTYTVEDGIAEFNLHLPGVYLVTVTAVRHHPRVFEIVVP